METVELAYDVYETPETRADKCPIIFIHGLFWNKFMLRKLAEALCNTTKRKVFCVDLRCHDQSPFREDCTVELMAEDVKRFMKDREVDKVTFVCHSISTIAAYFIAVDEPKLVEKIVMIDHLPFGEYTESWFNENVFLQFKSQQRFLETLDSSLSLAEAKRKILDLSRATENKAQKVFFQKIAYELIKVNNRFAWKTDHEFLIGIYLQKLRPVPRGRSDHEILVIRCANSTRVSEKRFEKTLKYNPNSKLVTIEETTHLLMFEKQEEFLEAVKNFLN